MTNFVTAAEATWTIWAFVGAVFLLAVGLLWAEDRRDIKQRKIQRVRREMREQLEADLKAERLRNQSRDARAKFLSSPANQQQPAEWFRNDWERPSAS